VTLNHICSGLVSHCHPLLNFEHDSFETVDKVQNMFDPRDLLEWCVPVWSPDCVCCFRSVRGTSAAQYEATLRELYTVSTVQVRHRATQSYVDTVLSGVDIGHLIIGGHLS